MKVLTKTLIRQTVLTVVSSSLAIAFASTLTLVPRTVHGQIRGESEVIKENDAKFKTYTDSPNPQAVVLWASGKAMCSEDGKSFRKLKAGEVLREGAIVRTDSGGRIDLYFRRMGVMGRLAPDSELALDKMTNTRVRNAPMVGTTLDLRSGGLYCFVRSLVADSRFEVKHKSGTDGQGTLEVRPEDGSTSTVTAFTAPKMISETAIAVFVPGSSQEAKPIKPLTVAPTEEEKTLIQLDELRALSETSDPRDELPPKK